MYKRQPQGPIASDFIAEIFLLPLDEAMDKAGIPYIRYVDDIRVLAKTEDEARRAAVVLEMECRRWSLIPQGSKFRVSYAKDVTEAVSYTHLDVYKRQVREVARLVSGGERRAEALVMAGRAVFAEEPGVKVDYVEVVDWGTLLPVEIAVPGTLFAVAAWMGATRLIDNAVLG